MDNDIPQLNKTIKHLQYDLALARKTRDLWKTRYKTLAGTTEARHAERTAAKLSQIREGLLSLRSFINKSLI